MAKSWCVNEAIDELADFCAAINAVAKWATRYAYNIGIFVLMSCFWLFILIVKRFHDNWQNNHFWKTLIRQPRSFQTFIVPCPKFPWKEAPQGIGTYCTRNNYVTKWPIMFFIQCSSVIGRLAQWKANKKNTYSARSAIGLTFLFL